jgi:ribonuclease HI
VASPSGMAYELSIWLEFGCTNNQAEYEALLSGLEVLVGMGAQRAEDFGDSKLVIQQVNGENQCLDGVLNEYKEECIKALAKFEKVHVYHVHRKDNGEANVLAQQASGFQVQRGKFGVGVRPRPLVGSVLVIQNGTKDSG